VTNTHHRNKIGRESNVKLFCGIDWAEAHHDVAIVDSDGQLVAKKTHPRRPYGLRRPDRNAYCCR
jgi:hypothetical protein